jgi:hypothetical protein
MKPGESTRFDCEGCGVEAEVVLEPKIAEAPAHKREQWADGMPSRKAAFCPFCGDPVVTDEEE